MTKHYGILHADFRELLDSLPTHSVHMALFDPPYGKTARNGWDKIVPPGELWPRLHRVCKPNAAIVVTAMEPFASLLIASDLTNFRYDWIWAKNKSTNFLNAKKMPLRRHEHVLVFSRKPCRYFPQKTTGHNPVNSFTKHTSDGTNYGHTQRGVSGGGQTDRYPTTLLFFPVVNNDDPARSHPTQKPVSLFQYLIETYTRRNEVVLDPFVGSGTTAVACLQSGRRFIAGDSNRIYVANARKRVSISLVKPK